MRRHYGRTVTLVLVGLVGVSLAWLWSEHAGKQLCKLAAERLPAMLGMELGIGECRVDPFRASLELKGLRFAQSGDLQSGTGPLSGEADAVRVRVGLLGFLAGMFRVERLELDAPRISLDLTRFGMAETTTSAPSGGCFLDPFSRFELRHLTISDAMVEVKLTRDRSVELSHLDLEATEEKGLYTTRVSVGTGALRTGGLSLPVTRLRIDAGLDVRQRRLGLDAFEVVAGDLALTARGEAVRLCASDGPERTQGPGVNLELRGTVPLDLAAMFAGRDDLPRMVGNAEAEIAVSGPLNNPKVEVDLKLAGVRINQFVVGDAFAFLSWADGKLRLDRLDLPVGKGQVRVRGLVTTSANFATSVDVELDQVSFGTLVSRFGLIHPWVDFLASGQLAMSGTLAPFRLSGPAELEIANFRVWGSGFDQAPTHRLLEFDRASLAFNADFDSSRVRMTQGSLRSQQTDADLAATLAFDPMEGLKIEADFSPLDLSDLGHLLGIPISGRLEGSALISGPYSDVAITSTVVARDLTFHVLKVAAARAGISFHRGLLQFEKAELEQGRTRVVAQGSLDLNNPGSPGCRARGSFEGGALERSGRDDR